MDGQLEVRHESHREAETTLQLDGGRRAEWKKTPVKLVGHTVNGKKRSQAEGLGRGMRAWHSLSA